MGGFIVIVGAALQTAAQNVNMFIGSRAMRKYLILSPLKAVC